MQDSSEYKRHLERILKGGSPKYHEKNAEEGKGFARQRIAQLVDSGTFIEDGLFANCLNADLPADGVVTGLAQCNKRWVAVVANDSTVKAGSWGARTVEKMIRIQEKAESLQIPVFYLIDSAGARITDQVEMFPGRRGAGRIFRNQAVLSGKIPQICILFGPSAAGGAYIPAFCDVVFLVEKNASMYLGSPRMAEAVIGEKVSLEEMGGARMHCTQSGCGDFLVPSESEAIDLAKKYLSYFPQNFTQQPPIQKAESSGTNKSLKQILPDSPARAYDMREVIDTIVDRNSFLEIKALYAGEMITGLARLEGAPIGIVANQPKVKGGVLFVESSNKAARFIQLCNAFNIPLLFLADVPGFMIGSKVEKEGMIRAGAKMIHSMSNATVPKVTVIIRKAYGAGLYAMCGPAYDSDAVLALPSAAIAVMGPEPAVNAVFYNKINELSPEKRKSFIQEKMADYEKDVNIYRMASELVVDALIDFDEVRTAVKLRIESAASKWRKKAKSSSIIPM
ncbi:acyl-CoA carboxylase subunit beta [bacterium]|nr:acyl-CoA carboxylase subunit beta [bacterium]